MDGGSRLASRLLRRLEGWVFTTSDGESSTSPTSPSSPSWHLSRWFVAEATVFNMTVLFFALFFWVINRQTHIKKTKGSVIIHKRDVPSQGDDENDSDEMEVDDDDDDEMTQNNLPNEALDESAVAGGGEHKKSRQSRAPSVLTQKQDKCYRALIQYDTDKDEDDDGEPSSMEQKRRRKTKKLQQQIPGPDQPLSEKQRLINIVAKIKVFSYLNEEALNVCMSSVEYVDVAMGKYLFERDKFDGSFYVVVSGSVRCRFHDFYLPDSEPSDEDDTSEDASSNDSRRLFGLTSGPGQVVTPLLAMLTGLAHHSQKKDGGVNTMPFASSLSCMASSNNTRLIRLPPSCFIDVLNKYPADVHRIAQTVLCRIQRVTTQTLVRSLGLRKELLVFATEASLARQKTESQEWMKSNEWKRLVKYFATNNNEAIIPNNREELRNDATIIAAIKLGIPHEDDESESMKLLKSTGTIMSLPAGEVILQSGKTHNFAYLLLNGEMETGVEIPTGGSSASPKLASSWSFHRHEQVLPGTMIGMFVCFTGEVSLYTVRATDPNGSTLLKIPKNVYNHLMILNPEAMRLCLASYLAPVSPVVHLLNWNSEWKHVQAGEGLAKRGSSCESIFVVLNGRLRGSYRTDSSQSSPHRNNDEYGRGKLVGEVLCLTGSSWPCDVYAIRNSEIALIPMRTLLVIIEKFPSAGMNFARAIASRIQPLSQDHRSTKVSRVPRNQPHVSFSLPSYGLTLATIAVVPLSPDIPLGKFSSTLLASMQEISPSQLVTKSMVRKELGEKVYRNRNGMHDLKMTRLLADMEENNRLVVYQADLNYTWWTRLCIQQADHILLVASADKAPEANRVEQSLAWAFESMDVRIDLVVVGDQHNHSFAEDENDDDNYVDYEEEDEEMNVSDQLNNWSEQRKWIAGHHLVRFPFNYHELDFRRMCRRVTGRSVGLVLGGGGARGISHLGVIRALKEAGVTVDMVGGTSQGAFVGALYARYPDDLEILMDECRGMASSMSSMKEKLFDLTLPMTSMFNGRRFNRSIRKSLGKLRIQDLVLNFFCVSTDLQKKKQVVHTKGLLWKFVRASMSLTGYLPPIAENGSLLVDGGYLNALPADVMRYKMSARTVISVDVSAENERDYYDYGTHLSGWWVLWNSWNPFVKTVSFPSMGDISDLLIWVSSDQHRKNVSSVSDLHLVPPIQEYGTLEYEKFDEIVEKGYTYAKPIVDEWVKQNPWLVTHPRPTTQHADTKK